eukprot:EG_transcript_24417
MSMSLGRTLVGFGILALLRGVDFEEDANRLYLRLTYAAVHVAIAAVLGLLYFRIKAKGEKTTIQVPQRPGTGDGATAEMTTTTVEDYDLSQLRMLLVRVALACGIGLAVHYKWGFAPPLFMQCWLNPFQVVDHQLSKVYLFGQLAKGALARPWKEPNPLGSFMNTQAEPPAETTRQGLKRQAKEAKKAAKKAS